MTGTTATESAEGKAFQKLHKAEIMRLSQPGALQQRMADFDRIKPFRRLYVMGCGRSGTWLLAAVMSTFSGLEIVPDELAVEYFGIFKTVQPMLVLKRDYAAYKGVENFPATVEIVYIVRHPFDVLTSHNPVLEDRLYHITPDRWLGEMLALQYLVETARPRTKIIRYEDLVRQPQAAQAELAAFFGLAIGSSIDDIEATFKAPPKTALAMHGLRKIDVNSIDKYRKDPAKLDYLRRIRPRLGRLLEWVGETYGYDISL